MNIPDLKVLLHHRELLAADPTNIAAENDIAIGALTLIGEARGESYDGRVAVAHTFHNRAVDKVRRVVDVCLEPAQYSCWWGEDPNARYVRGLADALLVSRSLLSVADATLVRACKYLVAGVLNGNLPDNTNGATHYCTQSLLWTKPPAWTVGHSPCATIGRHVFFRGIPWN